jgi:NAD(P)-dependent dehydrogenase (short-subunit alcohol dehydrogenase family)
MKKLAGKVAVITGGSSGIGLATAKRFIAEGAEVFITGRRAAELQKAVEEIGGPITAVQADVSVLADLDRLYETVREKAGRIDVLYANAGGGSFATLGSITEEQYDQTFDTNVKGTLFTVQKALPLLPAGASIILAGSATSITGTAAFSVYSATKAAIRNLARSWLLDLKGRDIRVNVLSPGPTVTPGLLKLVPPEHGDALVSSLAGQIPLGRTGAPDEIAKAAVFLASGDSSFVNGVELFADGGAAQV